MQKNNPRSANGNLRRKNRQRLKAMGGECGICRGRLGEIHWDEPSDAFHPLSFVVDEIIPVSKFREGGYNSRRECAEDFLNLQAAHYICNEKKSNHLNFSLENKSKEIKRQINISDGEW